MIQTSYQYIMTVQEVLPPISGEDLGGAGASWHGTMTSVVCAGDAELSNGLYKGIASDAELVLIKVQNEEARPDDPVGRGEGSTFIIKLPI